MRFRTVTIDNLMPNVQICVMKDLKDIQDIDAFVLKLLRYLSKQEVFNEATVHAIFDGEDAGQLLLHERKYQTVKYGGRTIKVFSEGIAFHDAIAHGIFLLGDVDRISYRTPRSVHFFYPQFGKSKKRTEMLIYYFINLEEHRDGTWELYFVQNADPKYFRKFLAENYSIKLKGW